MKKNSVKSDISAKKSTVIGVFEGECADSNITNKNGLDITREVWENVFNSDEFAEAIRLGFYIGFLGHPEDPACQDFKDACIVMTEGHIDDNGKVYGKFNLIDTPVGRVVKAFIDAGVTFGISVRGAGDIIDNSVDPDTFVFRGFDLVTFPAFPESIPTFTEIAASTDLEKQKKYKAVCAAVKSNLEDINSAEAIEIMQSQFAKQSDEYKMLQDKKDTILCEDEEVEDDVELLKQKVECMTKLYIEASQQLRSEKSKNQLLERQVSAIQAASNRKVRSLERITAAQMKDVQNELTDTILSYSAIKAATQKLKDENIRLDRKNAVLGSVKVNLQRSHEENRQLRDEVTKLTEEKQHYISANSQLKATNKKLSADNLIYKQRIEATANDIRDKESIISDLRSELSETVNAATELESQTSNRDATIQKLRQEVKAATALVQEYQDAYANMYASAVGVNLEGVSVTASTTVKELQSMITGSINHPQMAVTATEQLDVVDDIDSDGIVTV